MKALITAALLTVSTFANAGVINLKCNYINVVGTTNTEHIVLNTTAKTGRSVDGIDTTTERFVDVNHDMYAWQSGSTLYFINKRDFRFATKTLLDGIDTNILFGKCTKM